VNHNFGTYCSASQEFALSAGTSDLTTTYFLGKSPFPALDKFVESIASIGTVLGVTFFQSYTLNNVKEFDFCSFLFYCSKIFLG
jgi:hypothetical protein